MQKARPGKENHTTITQIYTPPAREIKTYFIGTGATIENYSTWIAKLLPYTKDKPLEGGALFIAEFYLETKPQEPESILAKAWHKYLGPTPIPFDVNARDALIKHACRHPEMKRHIDAWKNMSWDGQQWITK